MPKKANRTIKNKYIESPIAMGRHVAFLKNKKLAAALNALHDVLDSDLGVVRGSQLKQSAREILLKNGFLQEIIKGWYFVSDPTALPGDTTPFFANYWNMCRAILMSDSVTNIA